MEEDVTSSVIRKAAEFTQGLFPQLLFLAIGLGAGLRMGEDGLLPFHERMIPRYKIPAGRRNNHRQQGFGFDKVEEDTSKVDLTPGKCGEIIDLDH